MQLHMAFHLNIIQSKLIAVAAGKTKLIARTFQFPGIVRFGSICAFSMRHSMNGSGQYPGPAGLTTSIALALSCTELNLLLLFRRSWNPEVIYTKRRGHLYP